MKSYESTLLEISICILRDVMERCAVSESAARDLETLRSRVEYEGLSFLTITLPSFGADFERSLADGCIDSKNFRSFRKFRRIPAFLRGIVSQIFDTDTGRILNDVPSIFIEGVRQFVYAFKKIKIPCSVERTEQAFQGYLQDELDLSEAKIQDSDREYFLNVVDHLWDWLPISRTLRPDRWLPKHGPGATAERISGNRKYIWRRWHDRLEPFFPSDQFTFGVLNAIDSKEFEDVEIVTREQEQPVRVITVPKTLKSPRIIAIEPVCMQYAQQAISGALVSALEESGMTAGHVNFTDQEINQDFALNSSISGQMATLDLSSASDRVLGDLALHMFDNYPDLRDAIDACRSVKAELPGGNIVTLSKFASMGSALCFPVESMYFYTICVGALLRSRNLPVTSRNVFLVSRDVYIYGDDIVVPVKDTATVIDHLQKYYCKVNMRKSFWSGNFRESCGMDAFRGMSVTPTYIRELPPNNRQDAKGLISWVKSANHFNLRGYSMTATYLFNRCETILGKLPEIQDQSAALGRVALGSTYSIERWNTRYQAPEVNAWVPRSVYRPDKLDGYAALMKCLLSLERETGEDDLLSELPACDAKHLSRTARHGAVALQRRWVRPY